MRSSSNSNPKTLGDASGGSGSGGRPSLLSSSSSSSQDLSPTLTSSSSTPSSPPSPSPPPFPLNIPVPAPPPVLTIESVGPLSPIPTRASPYTPHSALLTPPSLQETPNPFDSLPSPPPDSDPHPPPPVPPPMHASPPPLAPPALQISIPPPGAGMHDPVLSDPMPFDGPPPPEPDSLDLSFDDEALSALEKIYLFSRSQANFHKVYITHALPSILPQVAPMDAVEYVLPLLSGLAMDDGNGVKEALATELVNIVWWFATNCRLTVDDEYDAEPEHYDSDYAPLSVHTFTPIIGTLLLSSASVGAATRLAVVEILRRVRDARDDDSELPLGAHERKLLEDEIVQQVVVGIGRLDMADEEEDGTGDRPEVGPEAEGENPARADPVDAPQSPPLEQLDYRIGQSATKIVGVEGARDLAALEVQQQQQRLPSPPPEADAVPVSSTDVADDQAAAEEGLPVEDGQEQDDEVDAEQAAVGRLSSMSLMAAVSAGGLLADDMRETFIREVERVGNDPIYWVRKEASYALGALAKVVPKEIVIMSLLPLFEQFTTDAIWHVRHSALFALPAILSRLSPHDRRSLALRTVSSLSQDPSPPVRTRLLETLGEVMYTFRDDPGGPPDEILQLFVGPDPAPSSSRPKTPPDCDDGSGNDDSGTQPPASSAFARARWPGVPLPTPSPTPPNDDGPRPLICAFNLPAVALTLGAARWPELAPLYARLATVRDPKVRKTLAASAGALARVVGRENAWRDVFGVWAAGLRADELEVRTKAVEAVPELVDALGLGLGLGRGEEESVLGVLERCWNERTLGWREREALVGALGECVSAERLCEREGAEVFRRIVGCAIEDETAAVRQAGIGAMPAVLDSLSRWTDVRASLEADVCALARAGASRSRVTFVACYRRLVAASPDERWLRDGRFWACVEDLVDDGVVDVRIGVARFVGEVYDRFYGPSASTSAKTPRAFEDVLTRLRADVSAGVRAYVPLARPQPAPCPPSTQSVQHAPSLRADALSPRSPTEKQDRRVFATFSLPPPPPVPSREDDGAELERFGAPLSGPGAPSLAPSEMADPSSTLQQPEKNEASEDSVRTPTMPGPASAGPSGSSARSSTLSASSSTSQAEAQHEASGAKSTSSEVVLALATLSAEISPTVRQAVQSQAPASFGGMPTISAPASAGPGSASAWPSTLPGNFSTSQIEVQQSTSAEAEPALASESAGPSSTSTWPSTLPVGYSASQIETQHESSVATLISPEVVSALAKVTRPDLAPAMTFEAPSTTKHERSARTDLQPAPVGKLESSSTAQTRSQAPRSAAPQVQTPPSATSTSAPSTAAIVARPGPPAALPSDKCPTPSVSSSLAGSGLGQTSSFGVLSDGGPSRTNHRRAQSFDVSASTKTNPVSLASPSAVVATAGEIDVSAGPAPLSRVPSNLESGTKGGGRAASVRVGAMA